MATITAQTEYGKVIGKIWYDYHGGEFYSFRGIPYAKSPTGKLRFMPCQAPDPWHTPLDATKSGAECPSLDLITFIKVNGTEENCLNLNIYTKKISTEAKKPVVVFIHGGGFVTGSNSSVFYGPQYLMTQDIVLVVINYRIGLLGFLSLKDKSLRVPGNNGLKDQVFALKWVQRNISNFGGDPNNVTIFGQSAGSVSVHYLMLSPLAEGLFHRAIMQSGSAANIWARGVPNVLMIAKILGYKEQDERSIFERLRKENVKSLLKAQFKFIDLGDSKSLRMYSPVIEYPNDGAFITENPMVLMKSGRYNKVPLMVGFNNKEGLAFGLLWSSIKGTNLTKQLYDPPFDLTLKNENDRNEIVKEIKKFYFKDQEITDQNIESRYVLATDSVFVYGIQLSISLMKHHQNNIYVYRYSHDGPLNYMGQICQSEYKKTAALFKFLSATAPTYLLRSFFRRCFDFIPKTNIKGAAHLDDICYLFSPSFRKDFKRGGIEDKCIERFVKLWTNFAACGNPTPQVDMMFDNVIWNPIDKDKMEPFCDIGETMEMTGNLEEKRMNFWDEIYQIYGN